MDHEVEVPSIWVLCTRQPKRMQGELLFEVGQGGRHFFVNFKKVFVGLPKACKSWALTLIQLGDPFLEKLVGGALVVQSQCHECS